jgi:NAD(P)H-dependent FMN reductase
MITIISGTNKRNSNSRLIAEHYQKALTEKGHDVKMLCLSEVDFGFVNNKMYSDRPEGVNDLQSEYFDPAEKFIFVVPEYNGSIPGALKLLIDALDVRSAFREKKAALAGVATGRAGNLRGLDHLTGILHHMRTNVMPGNLPISKVKEFLDKEGNLDPDTYRLIRDHADRFLKF